MQTALRENGHAHWNEIHLPRRHAVLANHPRRRVARDGRDEIRGPRVKMWREHSTGRQLEQRDADAEIGEGRERGGVSDDNGSVGTVVVWVLVEVVPPVAVGLEELLAVEVGGSHLQFGVEVGIDGPRLLLHGVRQRDESGEEIS